jgi:DNA-binding CsgD family transcriptional regulator
MQKYERWAALRWLGLVLAAVFAVLSSLVRVFPGFVYAATINLAYNAGLAAVAGIALATLSRSAQASARSLLPGVLIVSALFYAVALGAGIWFVLRGTPAPLVSTFAVGAYCLPWAAVALRANARYLAGPPEQESLPAAFASDYDLTPREQQVAEAVARGLTNARIAETQFVSVKTVETHLYNVYRKTGVKGRVELVNLIGRYAGGDASG